MQVLDDDSVILKHTLTGHQKPVSFVSWSPDSTMLLTSGNEEVVKLWDICTGTCQHTYDKPSSCFTSCAWFPDGHRFVLSGWDKCIYMWDLEV
jgi:WD40 repeat protein